jgi:hypothetical protein
VDWTKVPYYILDLIQQVPFVEVPGLGRFEAVLHPAVIDEAAAEALPPRMEAVFHTEGHGDRDLLSAYVAFASGITEGEAHEAILTFADEVARHTLDGATYEIIRFGTFFRNAEDKIRFTPDWEAFNLSFNGLQPVPLPQAVPATITSGPRPEIEPRPAEAERRPEPQPLAPIAAATSQPASPVAREDDEAPDASVRMWWGILMAAIFLIAVLCAYLAWDILSHRDALLNATSLPAPMTELPVVDTLGEDTVATAQQDTVALEVTDIPVTSPANSPTAEPEKGCYVVVGAFADTLNVERMESRLSEMGYAFERLPGRSIIRVAIRSSCDPVALQNVLDDARARISDQAWIY